MLSTLLLLAAVVAALIVAAAQAGIGAVLSVKLPAGAVLLKVDFLFPQVLIP